MLLTHSKQGSELEIDITKMLSTEDFSLGDFVTNWISACTTAEGRATTTKIEFLWL